MVNLYKLSWDRKGEMSWVTFEGIWAPATVPEVSKLILIDIAALYEKGDRALAVDIRKGEFLDPPNTVLPFLNEYIRAGWHTIPLIVLLADREQLPKISKISKITQLAGVNQIPVQSEEEVYPLVNRGSPYALRSWRIRKLA